MRCTIHTTLVASLVLFTGLSATADEISDKGRAIFTKNQHAVITVEVVQKAAASGRANAREAKTDLTAIVIDPSGLAVTALSSADPSELGRRLSEDYKAEIEISDVKILQEDGTEVPAEIVLRDKDRDLAFIRPKVKPTTPMAAIDLTSSSSAQALDQVITINRLKRAAGRAYSASVERISAVVKKPATFYIPDSSQSDTGMGSPAFALDGKLVGLFVMRAVNAAGASNYRDCITAIILPAEDIAKAAAQAPAEAKGDDDKKDAPKDADAKPETKPDAAK